MDLFLQVFFYFYGDFVFFSPLSLGRFVLCPCGPMHLSTFGFDTCLDSTERDNKCAGCFLAYLYALFLFPSFYLLLFIATSDPLDIFSLSYIISFRHLGSAVFETFLYIPFL